jgi:hypothetical protein
MRYDLPHDVSWNRRLEDESSLEFRIFLCYRGLGEKRSLSDLAKRLGYSRSYIGHLSAEFKWAARISAFEEWLAGKDAQERLRLNARAIQREARLSDRVLELLEINIERLLKQFEEDPKSVMNVSALVQALESVGRFARVGRGEPSERVGIESQEDAAQSLLESLKKYSMRGRGMYHKRIATKWNMTTMRHLLRNKTYMGHGSWNSVPMKAPVIVEQEVFDAVQHMLERNASFAKRYTRHEYLMRGLMFCECGAKMYGHTSHGRRFYRCGKNCGRKNVRAEPIEQKAFTYAYQLLSSSAVIRELYRRQKKADPERGAIADAMSSVTAELERLPDERKRVTDAYQRGVGDLDDLQKRLARLNAREEKLRTDLTSLQTHGERSVSQAERRSAWLAAFEAVKREQGKKASRASAKALILEWSQDGKTPGLFETQQTIVRAVYERVVHRPEKDLLYEATVPVPLRKSKSMWAAVTRRGSSMKLARIRAS